MKTFVIRWIVTTVAIYVASTIVPGIHIGSLATLVGTSLLLGVVNSFMRPILLLLSTPFVLLTMGTFVFVINALLLSLVAWLLPYFQIEGFWSAFLASFFISLISWMLNLFFRTGDRRIRIAAHRAAIKRADAHR
ncbi:MAG: phage holin family protein [Candidatus Xiphinematobacter sp.]|nr:MAG: phage holin family protein [Candidatus Xiphinematobacter sp.]QQY10039.1 MAG: phage holin family protein [Candidatus Xiphinematobacter sp.]QQY10772.1 MAG: phage holin family protein [Candidatus Xiphinematobacter sp.]QQY11517.1 MAG: phage holin family protein [Candidatus Xiphinematobacter sp.]